MAIFNYLKKKLRKGGSEPTMTYVRDESVVTGNEWTTHQHSKEKMMEEMERDIDLTRQTDLEGYARDINISKESIERWISSGLLMPEELKVAEKLVQIMLKH